MKSLLIIDDSVEYLEMLEMALSKEYSVVTVSDLKQLHTMENFAQFDALLIDFHIGFYSAHDALKTLRQAHLPQSTPIILLTGSVDIDKERENLKVTASLEKPFKIARLKELIKEVLV